MWGRGGEREVTSFAPSDGNPEYECSLRKVHNRVFLVTLRIDVVFSLLVAQIYFVLPERVFFLRILALRKFDDYRPRLFEARFTLIRGNCSAFVTNPKRFSQYRIGFAVDTQVDKFEIKTTPFWSCLHVNDFLSNLDIFPPAIFWVCLEDWAKMANLVMETERSKLSCL